ncbi:hypothetical protein L3Q82_012542 [Scortum barcoo]|uniref:Uncharacterized protein n=1 Tax=Scortum barcoo TaxID=214431 RepID=A0ACB8W352_9TELE|nr:hypothetical protein L3Q82_012542 [Scortum barcoo]
MHYRGPTLEPGLGLGLSGERLVAWWAGSLPTGPGRAQPEMATWAHLPVGSPPAGRSMRSMGMGNGPVQCGLGSSRGTGASTTQSLDQNSGNRDMESVQSTPAFLESLEGGGVLDSAPDSVLRLGTPLFYWGTSTLTWASDSDTWRGMIGRNGFPDLNPSGVLLLDFCASHSLYHNEHHV